MVRQINTLAELSSAIIGLANDKGYEYSSYGLIPEDVRDELIHLIYTSEEYCVNMDVRSIKNNITSSAERRTQRAWALYCEDTAGDSYVADCWTNLHVEIQQVYLNKVRDKVLCSAGTDHECKAYQVSDQMVCDICEQRWDMNDPHPPSCDMALASDPYVEPPITVRRKLYEAEGFVPVTDGLDGFAYETDPNGLNPSDAGAKLDHGKQFADLVIGDFALALSAVADVGTYGANKYSKKGWQSVDEGFDRYGDAGMRHYLKRRAGEECDPESELLHLAHEAWNKLAQLELLLRDEQPQQVEDVTTVNEIIKGSEVVVFDRYRFAIPLLAKVEQFSKHNDGVEVELLQSNHKDYPIGSSIWVHKAQLQIAT